MESHNLEDKLLAQRFVDENGHWLWKGRLMPNGYGAFQIGRRTFYAHRTSAYLYLGLDLRDRHQQACHKRYCEFKNCFNPEHLYIGTAIDNMADAIAMGRHFSPLKNVTHCKQGHEFTAANTYLGRRKDGSPIRDCRECNRDKDRRRAAIKKMAHALLVA